MKILLIYLSLILSGCTFYPDVYVRDFNPKLKTDVIKFMDFYKQERKITKIKTNGFYYFIDSFPVVVVNFPVYRYKRPHAHSGPMEVEKDKKDIQISPKSTLGLYDYSILKSYTAYQLHCFWVFDDGKYYTDYYNYNTNDISCDNTIFLDSVNAGYSPNFYQAGKASYSPDSIMKIILRQINIYNDYPHYDLGKGVCVEAGDSIRVFNLVGDEIEPDRCYDATFKIINDSTIFQNYLYSLAQHPLYDVQLKFYRPPIMPPISNFNIKGCSIFTKIFHKRIEFVDN